MPSHTRLLLFILLLAILLRVGVALYLGDTTPPGTDEFSYSLLAARLADGHGYSFADGHYPFTPPNTPTAHWSFLYSALVAAIYVAAGPHPLLVRLLQAVITGLLMPWLTWRLARRAFPAPSPVTFTIHHSRFTIHQLTALLAALLSALYAYFVLYGAMTQTEGLFLLTVLWSLERALALRERLEIGDWRLRDWGVVATLGVSLAVATLLRQSILPWVAVLFGWLLWADLYISRRLRWRTLRALALVGLIVAAGVLPFTLRNYRVYGDFLLLNSNAGYAMYSAQHPMHGIDFQEYGAAPLPDDLLQSDMNEAELDSELLRRGIGFVLDDPVRYVRLSWSRLLDYLSILPEPSTTPLHAVGRLVGYGLYAPFILYGLILVLCSRDLRERSLLALLFMLCYSVVHVFTWAMVRYRLPVDAVAMPFVALALDDLLTRVLRRTAVV